MEIQSPNPSLKRSLILAGGGVRLAYHAGVLIALEEAGLYFNHVDGTSGGIFGTAMLASGISPKETAVRWRNLDLKGFMTAMPLKAYSNPNDLPSLGSADGIRKKIFPSLGIDVSKINANTILESTFNLCNFSNKTIESITGQDVTEDHLIAGMSLPILMPAIQINNNWYTDAVWIKDCNMLGAISKGAEEIWLIWAIGNTRKYLDGSFNQYVHMIEISSNGGVYNEIEWLRNINAERVKKGLKAIDLHIVKPEYPLPLDPDFLFNKINADTLINIGYADTKKYLATDKKFDSSEEVYKSTAMTTVDASLHFRQQFMGKLIIGNKVCEVIIQLSFFIRQIGDQYILQQFSSVSIDQGDFISGYNNTIRADNGGKLSSSFEFYRDSINQQVNITMQLHGVIDLLIGIDNKTALVSIGTNEVPGDDSRLSQPAINRIKNAYYLNVNTQANWYGKIKLKHKLLMKLLNGLS